MDMNNLRSESHVAQKIRRNKLRFLQNSDDPTRQHLQPDPDFGFHRPRFGSGLPDPNVYPSDILQSIASNPQLLLPPYAYVDRDYGSVSVTVNHNQQQSQGCGEWNGVGYSNIVPICQGYDHQLESIRLVDLKNTDDVSTNGCVMYNYQNTLQNTVQEVVTCGKNFLETNEIQSIPCWMNGSDHVGFIGNRSNNDERRLSLSLSSVSQAKTEFSSLHSGYSGPKVLKTDVLINSDPKELMGMLSFGHRSVGPLGPFTGYATVLKNSKYLKPAQELLSDHCNVGGQDLVQECDNARNILEEEMSRVLSERVASSSSSVYGLSEYVIGRSGSGSESYRPEFHHKKAKLLYMQEEVCRRYKQYNQQMQLVIVSFESVAGLASATPFVSLALRSVSRHFHFVKTAILEQLAQMKKTFEDLCSPSATFGSTNTSDSLCQLKSISFANQQPLWRPQRGLPERAVSVLKAWLFDHFLHPYPSDADKHMLATQTGLTRNQVSNWFINARVRIWKPMVEEIHTLETKGFANPNLNPNHAPTDQTQGANHTNIGSLTNTQHSNSLTSSATLPNDQQPGLRIPQPTTDRAFASIIPYPRTTFEAGGAGPVSLTLALRQNAEHGQQLQVQHENQLRQLNQGQLIHDFVG